MRDINLQLTLTFSAKKIAVSAKIVKAACESVGYAPVYEQITFMETMWA